MANDFGIAIAPDFRDSPLRTVSPRALKLWLLLASHATHAPIAKEIAGHRITLGVGEWLASWRTLQQLVGCGRTQIGRALDELAAINAIEIVPVYAPRSRAVPNQDRHRSQSETAERSQNGTDRKCLLSRIKVNGMRALHGKGSGPESGTKRREATASPSWAERQQNDKALQVLAAEGR